MCVCVYIPRFLIILYIKFIYYNFSYISNFINESLVKGKDLEGPRQLFLSVKQQDSPR